MVKSSGGRAKAKAYTGGGGGGGGGGSAPPLAPSSPTRRLKKGGKRGRRLCHMDGCTLCPSFGFEGEVAVSCSHHKEDGMRNLTARRCQHEGCFTVANFGFPGDKPGYCAAHSTEGMVNRNKPRGSEGMLSSVTVARSSRRATKANSASAAEAAEKAAIAANRAASSSSNIAASPGCGLVRSRSSSGGKDFLLRAAAAREQEAGPNGGVYGENPHAATVSARAAVPATRARSNGARRPSYREEAGCEGDGTMRFGNGSGRSNTSAAGSRFKNTKTEDREHASVPPSLVPLASRGDDRDASGAGSNASSDAGRSGGGGGAGRVRPRGAGGAGTATSVTGGMLESRQGSYVSASPPNGNGGKVDHFHKRPPSAGGAQGGFLLAGREAESDTGKAGTAGEAVNYDGDVRMDGSFLMDGTFLEKSEAGDAPMGVDRGQAELRSILLGTLDGEDTSPDAKPKVAQRSFGSRSYRGARTLVGMDDSPSNEGARPSVSSGLGPECSAPHGRLFASSSGTSGPFESVIPGGGGGATGASPNTYVDFGLDSLPELNSNDFTGLTAFDTAGSNNHLARDAQQQQQQQHGASSRQPDFTTTAATSGSSAPSFVSVRLGGGGGGSLPLMESSSGASDDVSSEAFSSSDGSSSVSVNAAAGGGASGGRASGSDPLVAAKMPAEEAWWDLLEGEEFVAMPEPVWGVTLDAQSMEVEEESLIRGEPRGWQRNGGGGAESSSRMTENVNGGTPGLGDEELGGSHVSSKGIPHEGSAAAHPTYVSKSRPLLASCSSSLTVAAAGLGGVLVMPGDEGFAGDISSRGNRRDRNGDVDRGGGYGGGEGGGRGAGGGRLGPPAKEFAASVGEGDAFPLAFRIDGPIGTPAPAPGSSREMTPRGLGALTTTTSGGGGGSIFSSAASSSPNDIYPAPPAPVGFGLTVHHQVPLPHGGAGLRSAGQGVQGTYGGTISGASSSLSKAWVSGDTWATGEAISPSKCLSLSPVKPAGSTSTSPSKSTLPLLAQSTPPWGPGPLCSPQQTRAAGRA